MTLIADACYAGHFMSNVGCKECPVDTYSADGVECTACPENMGSLTGSKSDTDCSFSE